MCTWFIMVLLEYYYSMVKVNLFCGLLFHAKRSVRGESPKKGEYVDTETVLPSGLNSKIP